MKQTFMPMLICFFMLSPASAGSKNVVLPADSFPKFHDFLKRNPTHLSLSQFWFESFQEPELQLDGLLDICVLELTATPSPESCEVYLKRRAEIPMGSFDHNLFQKLGSRIKSDRFKNEQLKKWLNAAKAEISTELIPLPEIKNLTQKLESTKVLVQGLPIEDQSLFRNKVYQWTLLKDDSYPLTVLASYEELPKTNLIWTKLENEDIKKLERKFPERRFFQLNSGGEIDDPYESQLSLFQGQTKQQLSEKNSWGRWKLPVSLLVTGILIHSFKDKEIKITGLSF